MFKFITLSMWLLQDLHGYIIQRAHYLIAPGPRNNHKLATVRDVIAEFPTR